MAGRWRMGVEPGRKGGVAGRVWVVYGKGRVGKESGGHRDREVRQEGKRGEDGRRTAEEKGQKR